MNSIVLKIKRVIGWFVRKNRRRISDYIYKDYDDNPLDVDLTTFSRQAFLDRAEYAKSQIAGRFIDDIKREFGYLIDSEFIHDLALTTQITIKVSKPLYSHGYLLYGAVRKYLECNKYIDNLIVLETGTARGFSALVMAKALDDANRQGEIITLDKLPSDKAIYWNCIHDHDGRKTRLQLLDKWRKLIDDHILFVQGYSDVVLRQLTLPRINVAFLDGGHDYRTVKYELHYVKSRQLKGDIIICDDYTQDQYPGLVAAANEFLADSGYLSKIFKGSSKRMYLYCKKN